MTLLSRQRFFIVEHRAPDGPEWRQLVAYEPGAPADEENDLYEHQVGLLSYRHTADIYEVGNRRTHEEYRRSGVASLLQRALEDRAAGMPVVSTDEGITVDAVDFHRAYKARNPDSLWTLAVDQ